MSNTRSKNNLRRVLLATLSVLSLLVSTLGATGVVSAEGSSPPYIQIEKTGPDTANPGESIVFTLRFKTYNSGIVTEGVVWDDLYYGGLDRYEIFRRALTASELETLNGGGVVTVSVAYQVPCDAGGHVVDNDAYVRVTFSDGTTGYAANDHDVSILPPAVLDCHPAIDLEKWVNGQDADTPAEAVLVKEGDLLIFTYIVTNTGDEAFYSLVVTDDNETPGDPTDDFVVGTIANLAPGQSTTFTRGAVAAGGLHTDVGTVCGRPSTWGGCDRMCDADAANYLTQVGPGTGTPGYWMNHPEAWPVETITIGGITYNKDAAITYMKMPVKGDKTLTMFPALVAAKLNVLIGNDSSCIADTIAAADAWMALHPIGSGVEASSQAWKDGEPLYERLDWYNNGELCAPARD